VGTESTCAIDAGALKCWGYKLANGTLATSVPTITGGMSSGVTAVSLRASTVCAVASGAAKCLGVNTRGQLGNGLVSAASYLPVQPTGLGSSVTLVAAGTKTSCAVQSNLVYCWGDNVYHQASTGVATVVTAPTSVSI
jgi:alpha-tubulin suppressor-like RCC1 family protein